MPKILQPNPEWIDAFDRHFWPNYPRKVCRIAALESWKKLARGVKDLPELLGDIVQGLEWWKENEWRDRDRQKIPHATTWLNQRRWEDAFGTEDYAPKR